MKFFEERIIKIEDLFKENERITLSDKKLILFLNGGNIMVNEEDGLYKISNIQGKFIGLGEVKEGRLKRDVVMKAFYINGKIR